MKPREPARRWERIWHVVSRIPEGRVATYGQVAALAGLSRAARQVGYALHGLPAESDVPWQRVVNARGELSARRDFDGAPRQRARLEEEGIEFDARGRIDLDRYRWRPGGRLPGARVRSRTKEGTDG